MNLANLGAVTLLTVGCLLFSIACLFSSIPFLEDMNTISSRQQTSLFHAETGMEPPSAAVASLVFALIFGVPALILSFAGVSLWWFVGRARQQQRRTSIRVIYAGQVAGLLLTMVGLLPLLWIFPSIAVVAVQHPALQEYYPEFASLQHPLGVVLLIMQMVASMPLSAGAGLLFLARTDLKLRAKAFTGVLESDVQRWKRQGRNLRLERLCLLLVSGVAVSLAGIGYLISNNVWAEYFRFDRHLLSSQQSFALEPEAYLSGLLLLSIPGILCAFLAVGIRVLFIRPTPRPALPRPVAPVLLVSSPTGALRVPATARPPGSAGQNS